MRRTEKSLRNLKYGLIYQLIDVLLKFALRTAMVYILGDAVVGLNGLFTEILTMLSLAEMGVGSAIIYSLYQPLSRNDTERLRRLMALFKRAYQIIALCVLLIGLCLTPFIHLLVRKVDFDLGYLRVVYLLYLVSTASSYLLSYKASLLTADQCAYKVTQVKIVMDIVSTVLKLGALLLFKNFLLFLALNVVFTLARNFFISRSADRQYPYLREKSELPEKQERREIFKNIRHLFIGKLSGTITNSTDNTLISVMDSTLSVGFYSNYAMIINNARTFMTQIVASAAGGIGNQMTEDLPHCHQTLKRLTMCMAIVGSTVCACFYSQLSPLISLWLGRGRVLNDAVVLVLLLNLFLYALREPLWQFLTVSGQFKKDKNISIIGSVVNLILSVALGLPLGMLGIFIGTTATLVIQYVLKARLLLKEKLGRSFSGFMLYSGALLLGAALSAGLSKAACGLLPVGGIAGIILGVALSALISLLTFSLLFFKTQEYRYCLRLAMRVVRKLTVRGKKKADAAL